MTWQQAVSTSLRKVLPQTEKARTGFRNVLPGSQSFDYYDTREQSFKIFFVAPQGFHWKGSETDEASESPIKKIPTEFIPQL